MFRYYGKEITAENYVEFRNGSVLTSHIENMISNKISEFRNYITSIFVQEDQSSMAWYNYIPGILVTLLYSVLCTVLLVKFYEKTSKYMYNKFHIQPYHERLEANMLPDKVNNIRMIASTHFTRKRILCNAIYLDSLLKRRYQLEDYYWKTHEHDFD